MPTFYKTLKPRYAVQPVENMDQDSSTAQSGAFCALTVHDFDELEQLLFPERARARMHYGLLELRKAK
jgi:hypothetical protein